MVVMTLNQSTSAAALPPLGIVPTTGPCDVAVQAQGSGFPAGSSVVVRGPYTLKGINQSQPYGIHEPRVTVAPDGTFMVQMMPCTAAMGLKEGERVRFIAEAIPDSPDEPAFGATALFTVTIPTPTVSTIDSNATTVPIHCEGGQPKQLVPCVLEPQLDEEP